MTSSQRTSFSLSSLSLRWALRSKRASSQPSQRRRAQPRGFSLIEVMVASAILLVGISASVIGFGAASQAYTHQQKLSQATLLAEANMEELIGLLPGHANLDPGAHGPRHYDHEGRAQATPSTYAVSWTITTTAAGLRDIIVKVQWQEQVGTRSLSLRTQRL